MCQQTKLDPMVGLLASLCDATANRILIKAPMFPEVKAIVKCPRGECGNLGGRQEAELPSSGRSEGRDI